jgi:hypothetical protein
LSATALSRRYFPALFRAEDAFFPRFRSLSRLAFSPVAFVTFYRGPTKVFETPPRSVTDALSNRLKTMPGLSPTVGERRRQRCDDRD